MEQKKSTTQTQVLIVGAGPTGLAAAATLTQLGVRVRIIDKNTSRSDKSKALGVQAGTLECLAKALGSDLTEKMIADRQPTNEAFIHLNDQSPIKINLNVIASRFNFILILAQSETERILEEYLARKSVSVERNTELISFEIDSSKVLSTIQKPSGEQEILRSDFLIGCDGAHSTVRHQLQIPFMGNSYTGDFILGDVKLEWPWPYKSIQTFISSHGLIASFPLKGEQRYRLVLIPKTKAAPDQTNDIRLDEFRSIASLISKNQISILESTWLTRFRVHHRVVEHLQKGRAFLAGDAAHIHSPAGGQGMNTGIQDALNLSFKIGDFLAGRRDLQSLSDYEKERLPVAKSVLKGTDLFTKMALLPENPLVSFIRKMVIPKIVSSKWVQKRVITAMSEVAIAAKEMARCPQQN
jgi:3-(3-hydroxy-phenyl)propionate hydroxylase